MASLKANKLANPNTELANIRRASPRVSCTEEDIHVYGYGQFQRMALLCSIVSFFMNVVHSQTLLVMSRPVAHWCKPPDEYAGLSADEWKNTSIPKDVDGQFSSCTRYEPPMPTPADNKSEVSCDCWDYDSEVGATIVRDFSLVCDRIWLLRALRFVYSLGGSVLLPVMGSAADKYGRRAVLGLTLFGLVISGVVTSLVETLVEFAVLQLLTSASISTFQAISTVLLFEVTPQDHRMLFCMLNICVPLVLGTVVLGLIGTTSMHWSAMQLVVLSPTLLLLLTYHLTDEAPRWLITSWKFKDAERVILWAARKNGLPDLDKVRLAYFRVKERAVSRDGFTARPTIFNIVSLPPLRSQTLIVFGGWWAIFNCYYSIAEYKSFGGGAVSFYIMIGIANMFTQTVNYFVLRGYGRRKPISAYFLGLSVLMTSLAALVALGMELAFAKVAVSTAFLVEVAFTTMFVFTVELYPTAVRSAGMCGAFLFGRLGGISASLFSILRLLDPPMDRLIPMLVNAVVFFTLGLLVVLLPETLAMRATDKGQEAAQEDKWRLDSPLKRKKKSRQVPRKCIVRKLDR
ncbi:solute carrier family 22 member 7-like [Ixodes scapularis]|uniref:solute carrier family 22 member 7-like n=1 Tax=Ixodes scapularis TaxID=6945 RepID=UPI001A9E06AD|nr:solute carrier family 22 member 7-like [Ixodes scapularis]